MKFTHEFDPHGWRTFHRLVWINPKGERIAGDWALFESPAFLSAQEMDGTKETEMTPRTGYFALTDYYTSNGSLVAAYSAFQMFLGAATTETFELVVHELTKEEHQAEQAAEGEANDEEFALKA